MVKTVKVTGYAYHQNGEPAANAKGVAILSQYELDDGVVVPHQVVFRLDENGYFEIDLWPNERGTGKSFYEVIIYHKSPEPFEALIYVPDEDHDVRFKDILVQLPPSPISDAERILQEVISNAYASSVSASESADSATIATNKAQDAANSASAAKDIADDSAKSANIAATLRDETASLRQQTHSLKENADASASAALASQNAAKTSETNSKASEVAAKASETASSVSESNASTSESNAATSASNAKDSEIASKASEVAAKASENAAKASQTASKASEDSASASATTATTKASEASTSAQESADSAASIVGAVTESQEAASNSQASATAAATSASNALTSETNAATSADSASSSASAASTSSTTAQGAATTATNAAVDAGKSSDNAAVSASSAESAKDDAYSYLNKAEQWASKLGSPVEGDEYSAKYWAKHAEANSNVKFATETVAGISRFGTQEEVIDGELDNVIVSPKYLKEVSDTKVDKVTGKGLSDENYSLAEKGKLEGVADEATKNATDEQLRDRATHTGVQSISTIDGLQTSLDAKANITDIPDLSELGDVANINTTNEENKFLSASGKWEHIPKYSLASAQEDGLMSSQDKVSMLTLYDDYTDRFGTLTKAIKLVYTEDVTITSGSDIEVSYEGVDWRRGITIPKNTPVFIRNFDGSSEFVDLFQRQYISEIIFWGRDITRLSLIGGTLLSKVPLTIPNALTNMSQMFEGCSSFNQNISTWAVGANITDMTSMFKGCSAFNQDLSSWNGTSALYIDFALGAGFENNPEKHPLWAPPIEFEVWREDLPPKYVATTSAEGDTFYEKEGLWFYVAPVTNNRTQLSQLRSIVELYTDLEGDFPTVNITDKHGVTKSIPLNQVVMTFVSHIYQDVSHRLMVTLGNSNFNQYIGSWDLTNCTNVINFLRDCTSFNHPLNLDLPNCTNASNFLRDCTSFNQDISNACVPKITSAPTLWNQNTPASFRNDTSKHPVWGTCPSN